MKDFPFLCPFESLSTNFVYGSLFLASILLAHSVFVCACMCACVGQQWWGNLTGSTVKLRPLCSSLISECFYLFSEFPVIYCDPGQAHGVPLRWVSEWEWPCLWRQMPPVEGWWGSHSGAVLCTAIGLVLLIEVLASPVWKE